MLLQGVSSHVPFTHICNELPLQESGDDEVQLVPLPTHWKPPWPSSTQWLAKRPQSTLACPPPAQITAVVPWQVTLSMVQLADAAGTQPPPPLLSTLQVAPA